jgi:hypothetical protein
MSTLKIIQNCCTIQLTKGQNTLVDIQDWLELRKKKWCALHLTQRRTPFFYAVRNSDKDSNGKRTMIYMHRALVGLDGMEIDHENHDTLDNRRDNLRLATKKQNAGNSRPKLRNGVKSSQYKGVTWHKGGHKWMAAITVNKKPVYLGLFNSEIEAAKAYDRAAKEVFGEFACLNDIT